MIKKVFHMAFGGTSAPDPEPPIPEVIARQKNAPYYCGTAFCGHATKKAAAECSARRTAAINAFNKHLSALEDEGRREEAYRTMFTVVGCMGYPITDPSRWPALRSGEVPSPTLAFNAYPEADPRNWPVNRSKSEMQREFVQRAQKELNQGRH